jgi:hypothetical protein
MEEILDSCDEENEHDTTEDMLRKAIMTGDQSGVRDELESLGSHIMESNEKLAGSDKKILKDIEQNIKQ